MHRTRRGVTAIEYGLLCFLIIVAAILAVTLTGTNLKNVFAEIGSSISGTIASSSAGSGAGQSTPALAFQAGTPQQYFNACSGAGAAFVNGSTGEALGVDICGNSLTQSELTANLQSTSGTTADYPVLWNSTGGAVSLPALHGKGTGFTVDHPGLYVILHQAPGSSSSFTVSTSGTTSTLSSSELNTIAAACAANGGTMATTVGYATYNCQGGTLYTSADPTTMINSGF